MGNDTDVDEGEFMSADALAAGSTVRPGTEEAWRDGKRYLSAWVVAHYGGDVRLANIAPGKEARYLEAYPPPAPERSGHADGHLANDWSCPDCGVRDKVDFRVLADELPAPDAAQP